MADMEANEDEITATEDEVDASASASDAETQAGSPGSVSVDMRGAAAAGGKKTKRRQKDKKQKKETKRKKGKRSQQKEKKPSPPKDAKTQLLEFMTNASVYGNLLHSTWKENYRQWGFWKVLSGVLLVVLLAVCVSIVSLKAEIAKLQAAP